MPIVRQMPKLYIRGSLANVTMKNLTADQIEFCNRVTKRVADHDKMKRHKYQVMRVLGETIGADYRDNKETAEQEYTIAIWRAVVNLYFHKHYTFQCTACENTHRITKTTKLIKPFDQAHIPCPACNKVLITDPGDTKYTLGEMVDFDEFQDSYADFVSGIPSCDSCIVATPGGGYDINDLDELFNNGELSKEVYDRRKEQYRYDDPNAVVEDEEQMAKFFGEFVWSYFKQQLRENQRVEHKEPTKIIGSADQIITEEIVSACGRHRIPIVFCRKTQPENGWWSIGVVGLQTPPEFTIDLAYLLDKAASLNIPYKLEPTFIRIKEVKTPKQLSASVTRPEHVTMVDNSVRTDTGDSEEFAIHTMSFKTVRGIKVPVENHVDTIDRKDIMQAVYESLPGGDCQKIFQLYSQDGELYQEFFKRFGEGEPKQTHIAQFLGITTRSVKQHIEIIRLNCLASGFTKMD